MMENDLPILIGPIQEVGIGGDDFLKETSVTGYFKKMAMV